MSTQHLLSCDEHPQPHQVGVLGCPFLLVVVGQYQTRTLNNISNVVFIILKDIIRNLSHGTEIIIDIII